MFNSIIVKVSTKYLFIRCDNNELIAKCMKVRHKVYCNEKQWEKVTNNQMEQDKYDINATHYLVVERSSQLDVGTFRIIQGESLPLAQYMDEEHILHPGNYVPHSVCELSRLSMLEDHRGSRLITALLLYCGYETAQKNQVGCYAVMENRLALKLNKIGITTSRITNTFHKQGERAVYFSSLADILRHMSYDRKELTRIFLPLITSDLAIPA